MSSGHVQLFLYFIILALLGSVLLQIPQAYKSNQSVAYIDSLFTAVSAVCVTGLSTLDMSVYTRTGFCILLCLIEAGGLGIVLFITMISVGGSKKVSMVSNRLIRDYFIDDVETNPRRILVNILSFTLGIQLLGAIILTFLFGKEGVEHFIFTAFFTSVSAFCNAGFSVYSDSLASFTTNVPINVVVMALIVFGGIGFIVMQNIWQAFKQKKHITLHTKLVLLATISLILLQAIIILIFDYNVALKGLTFAQKVTASFFQSITLRTAGFETIAQSKFTHVSRLSSTLLMLIGGSPASMAGGIKTTTFFAVLCYFIFGNSEKGSFRLFNRRIGRANVEKATQIITKSLGLIFVSLFLIFIAEGNQLAKGTLDATDLIFEVVSAFGTVGLSQGITSSLSTAGKIVIILTMYIGRTGIFAMALQMQSRVDRFVHYPEETVLIG